MKRLIPIIAIILLASCATKSIPVVAKLNCPPSLELPKLTITQNAELDLVSVETYTILVRRELLLQERNKTLCSIIESTHQ